MDALAVHVLDVGQAASIVLDFGGGRYGIVDCGGGGENPSIYRFLLKKRAEHPDMCVVFLLITHLDLDHVQAIGKIVADDDFKRRIERLYCNDLAYRRLLQEVRKAVKPGSGVGVNPANGPALRALRYLGELAESGSAVGSDFHFEYVAPETSDTTKYPVRLQLPSLGDDIEVLLWAPSQRLRDLAVRSIGMDAVALLSSVFGRREVEDWNSASAVLTVSAAGRRILLAGDATRDTWAEIMTREAGRFDGSDVTVAWHHGGRLDRSSANYDSTVWSAVLSRDEKLVLVSCGNDNKYAHPHVETLDAVRRCGGQVLCTQSRGAANAARSMPKHSVATMMLRAVARRPLVAEAAADARCCGDIEIRVGSDGGMRVACERPDWDQRVTRHTCCQVGSAPA